MFHHPDPEVLVVGAGPVGLVAALFLQQHGVRVEVVDMHHRTTQHSYALAIHPRTLRILDEAGLSEGLIGAGRKLTKVAYYEGRERRAEIDYSALASKHPYLLVIRQSLLGRAAEVSRARTQPAEVRVIVDPDLTSVYWPLEEGRCRWGFQIRDASEHTASMERLEQLIAARAPWCTARPTQIYWSTLGLFERRLTRSFGTGGVWLAGDAAHQAAPVGVHSLNSGLVEVRELAARISGIQRGDGAPSLLQ